MTLVRADEGPPTIERSAFPATPSSRSFWTSSSYAGLPDYSWIVEFYSGTSIGCGISQINYVRGVR